MTYEQVRNRIGAIVAMLGIGNLLDWNTILTIVVGIFPNMPIAQFTGFPAWVRVIFVVGFGIYALVVARKASNHNPDGSPAYDRYMGGTSGEQY